MALSSQEILQQIQGMGSMPDYKTEITKAYDAPVLKPLVQEGANLESQYLPALFDPFTKMGTGAADMSAAAKLSGVGSSLGRLTSRVGANNSIQNFYGAQIGDLAGKMSNDWRDQLSNLQWLYQAQAAKEDADRQAAAMAGWGAGGGNGGGSEDIYDVEVDDGTVNSGDATANLGRGLAGLYGGGAVALNDAIKNGPVANTMRDFDNTIASSPFLNDIGMRLGDFANWGLGQNLFKGYKS